MYFVLLLPVYTDAAALGECVDAPLLSPSAESHLRRSATLLIFITCTDVSITKINHMVEAAAAAAVAAAPQCR